MQRILNFVKHPTSRNIIINTVGNYLNVVFTAFFALLLVRILNPSEYGVMSVLLGIAYVLSNILDFGTTATIYSYLPGLYESKSTGLYRFIKSTFVYQSTFAAVVIVILFIFFRNLDELFFKTKAGQLELYLTSTSVILFIWQNFITNILFAAKKFVKANIYVNLANLIKTLVILYFVFQHTVTIGSIIFVFGILGPLLFFLFVFLEKKDLFFILMKAEVKREEFRFGYTFTYFIAAQFSNLGQRMDLFLLSYFGLKNDVGFYGLSQKIILTVISTVVSITQVLSPGYSSIQKKSDIIINLKRSCLYLMIPTALFVIIFFLPQSVYTFIFTDKFGPAAHIASLLSLPFIIYTFQNIPTLFLLYTVKKPGYILVANILFFITVVGGCFYFIPLKGVLAPPFVLLAAFSISFVYLMLGSILEYRKLTAKLFNT
jgi:O-antigen/teichoic acid export membrane protein